MLTYLSIIVDIFNLLSQINDESERSKGAVQE